MVVSSTEPDPLPEETEARLTNFTELVATAIANAEARERVERLAQEQAALRRVATLIARAASAEAVFSAVAEEVASVLNLQVVTVCRYQKDAVVVLSSLGIPAFPAGSRWPLKNPSLPGSVYSTGAARPSGRFPRRSHRCLRHLRPGARWERQVRVGCADRRRRSRLGERQCRFNRGASVPGRGRGAPGPLHRPGRHLGSERDDARPAGRLPRSGNRRCG